MQELKCNSYGTQFGHKMNIVRHEKTCGGTLKKISPAHYVIGCKSHKGLVNCYRSNTLTQQKALT